MRQVKSAKGQILVLFLTITAIGLLLAGSVLALTSATYRDAKSLTRVKEAQYLAEAGIDKGFQAFTTNQSYTGETLNLGNGSVTISVTAGATANEKILAAIATSSGQTKRLRTKLVTSPNGTAVAFNYALQAGTNGFTLGNGSQITGSAYSNANITGGNGSQITMDAFAVGTITGVTVGGQTKTGQPAQALPTFDANFWKGKAQAGGTINGDYTPANGSALGPLYVVGNMTINNLSNITFQGPVYVQGRVNFGNNAVLAADNSIGANGAMLISEADMDIGNSLTISRNQSGGYLLLISSSSSSFAVSIGNTAIGLNGPIYAPNGTITLGNSAKGVAFTGKGINLGNTAEVKYDQGLATESYTFGGPGGGWTMAKGEYQEY